LVIPLPNAEVILMGQTDVQDAVGRVLAALREAGRAEATIRCHEVVLDRFVVFVAGRGVGSVSERVCIDFVEKQIGVRLGSLRESVNDRDVKAVRRAVVLIADVLAGRPVEIDRSVIPSRMVVPPGSVRSEMTTLPAVVRAAMRRRPWSRGTARPAGF
jgi:hypothetical protein